MSLAVWLALMTLGPPRYEVALGHCYDGDTCTFDITLERRKVDLGLGVMQESRTWVVGQSVRLCDVDTPEMRHDRVAATRARDALVGWLTQAKSVELEVVQKPRCLQACDRQEKYGRWLGYLYADGVNLNLRLVKEGYAKPYILCR